jgi:hypothetical protein
MNAKPRELSSPLSLSLLELRDGDERMLQVRRPLSGEDTNLLDRFLEKWPKVWLRAYAGVGQRPQDWNWLGALSNLKNLWLDLLPGEFSTTDFLDVLPETLSALYLPASIDWNSCAASVVRLHSLVELSLSGKKPKLQQLASLIGLRKLILFRATNVRIAELSACAALEVMDIQNGSKVDLSGLEELTRLNTVRVFNCGIRGVASIAGCRHLRKLELIDVRADAHLPGLHALTELTALRVASFRPGYSAASVLAPPSLTDLALDTYRKDCTDPIPEGLRDLSGIEHVHFGLLRPEEARIAETVLRHHLEKDLSRMPFGGYEPGGD